MRITQKDKRDYARLKKNVSAKIDRVKNTHNIDISSDIDMTPLENMDRRQFNQFKDQAKVMTKRGVPRYSFTKLNEHVSVSQSELNQLNYNKRLADRQAEKRFNRIKDKPYYDAGRQQSTVGQYAATMKDPDIPGINAPNVQPLEKIPSREYVQSKIEQLDRYTDPNSLKKTTDTLKTNYVNKLKETFNSDAADLIKKIEGINPEDFLELYGMSGDMDIKMFYIGDLDLLEAAVENTENHIDKYMNGETDMDFKTARNNQR